MSQHIDGQQRHLFLDLEDTVIDPVHAGWCVNWSINWIKVKKIAKEFNPTHLHLFSFAIHSQHDIDEFNKWWRKDIEQALGLPIMLVPTIADITRACCSVKGLAASTLGLTDLIDFWGKQDSFKLFCRHLLTNPSNKTFSSCQTDSVSVLLLDDVVFNEEFSWKDLNFSGQIVCIA